MVLVDSGVWIDFFNDAWENVDYIVLTPGMAQIFARIPGFSSLIASSLSALRRRPSV